MRFRGLICAVAVAAIVLAALPALAQHATPAPVVMEEVPLFEDLGEHRHPITARGELAQRYFDQGLRLVYGFNHDESIRAFRAAAVDDPTCAMAHWGIALSLGPNYNLEVDPEREARAVDAIQEAQQLAAGATAREQAFIEALATRYSIEPDADRKTLDRAYAIAMGRVAKDYPDNDDAAVLYADALMVLRPWDLWKADGEPQEGTPVILTTLESVLARNPKHPGANHLYIHAVEASNHPEKAIPCADRLGGLMPGSGHLVHMPSHIYYRVGRYADAARVNAQAIEIDRAYIERCNPQGVYRMMYYPHNVHFLWAALCVEGRSAEAESTAEELAKLLTPEMVREMPMVEYFMPIRLHTWAQNRQWDKILEAEQPPEDFQYTRGMWHYARGLAFLGKGDLDSAGIEARALAAIADKTDPEQKVMRHSAAQLLEIASGVLDGSIAARQSRTQPAVDRLQEAITLQDGLAYDEPPPWYYSVRQSLAAVLLAANRASEAEAVLREDLRRNPENGRSLNALAKCLRVQKKDAEAAKVEHRFKQAWASADCEPSLPPVF